MVRRLVLAATLLALAGACSSSPSSPRGELPSGACALVSFSYTDTSWGMRLGSLSDTLRLQVRAEGANAATFTAHVPQPILAKAYLLTDSTEAAELEFVVVASGDYAGAWLRKQGGVVWVFTSGGAGANWLTYAPWAVEGYSLVASWTGTGWFLKATVSCR